jgi:hypothetical protein
MTHSTSSSRACAASATCNPADAGGLANELGIAPGIVVDRYQHEIPELAFENTTGRACKRRVTLPAGPSFWSCSYYSS